MKASRRRRHCKGGVRASTKGAAKRQESPLMRLGVGASSSPAQSLRNAWCVASVAARRQFLCELAGARDSNSFKSAARDTCPVSESPQLVRFLAECTERSSSRKDRVQACDLHSVSIEWSARHSEPEWSATALGRAMRLAGYQSLKSCANFWLGLKLTTRRGVAKRTSLRRRRRR